MLDNLTISVSTFTFNRNDDLFACLQALSKQTFKDFNIIVVNGGDYEGVRNVVEKFNQLKIKVVNQERKGLVEARNLGWRHSEADIVCLIDDDLVVSPDWLENIKATFLSDDTIGGVSGPTIIPDDRQKNRDFALLLERFKTSKNILFRVLGKIYLKFVLEDKIHEIGRILNSGAFTPGSNYKESLELPGPIEVDYLEACHMCFRRRLIEEAGGFDYTYTGTGEWQEPDLSFRVRAKGHKLVFNPIAVTYHNISQGGVFKARTYAFERSWNFIYFYFQNVNPSNFDKIFRFSINLCFINGYWFYKFLKTRNPDWLSGITGTLFSLAKMILNGRQSICR